LTITCEFVQHRLTHSQGAATVSHFKIPVNGKTDGTI
jgi:hypothetical protein